MKDKKDKVVKIIKDTIRLWHHKAVIPGDGWTPESIAESMVEHCEAEKVQLELALAQGYVECHFGINPLAGRSRRTRNIFNVGNVDDGKDRTFDSWEAGIAAYCKLMRREYNWKEGDYISVESMEKHDFTRPKGGRYASAPDYKNTVVSIALKMRAKLEA